MRNATCVGTETSKVPTRVTLLFIFYSVVYVSQPLNATKIVAQSINNKIKLKQSEIKRYAIKILGFARFLLRIRDIEKKLPLKGILILL